MIRAKRGEFGHNELSYLVKVALVFIVFLVFTLMIRSHIKTEIDTQKTEADILFYRFIYSPHGLSYYDQDLDRLYPGIIDLGKMFGEDGMTGNLEKAVSYAGDDGGHIGARFKLFNSTGQEIMTFFYHEDAFRRMYPLSFGGSGPGSARRTEHSLYVLMHNAALLEKLDERDAMGASQRQRLIEEQKYDPMELVHGKLVATMVIQQQ